MKHSAIWALILTSMMTLSARADFSGVGRAATPPEVKAWDIDVRPDFAGLPPGSGSVAQGEKIWAEKCTSCHGDFGDDNKVFTPLIGNTTAQDIETGRVAALKSGGSVRTTFTKVSTVSTLWDYINRAMPWNAPKSLSSDEVYAVLAYLLNLAEIVPADYVLSDRNMADVQARMPNRNGMTLDHGLWEIKGKADTHNKPCVQNCRAEVKPTSELPAYAMNSHGNLADQNRTFGPVRGVATLKVQASAQTAESSKPATAALTLLAAKGCSGCHAIDTKILGPSFREITARYKGKDDANDHLRTRIRAGGSGLWGPIPMPPQPGLTDAELKTLIDWLLAGAGS